jgi:hypothetical protein
MCEFTVTTSLEKNTVMAKLFTLKKNFGFVARSSLQKMNGHFLGSVVFFIPLICRFRIMK